jgi:hypothetical protein
VSKKEMCCPDIMRGSTLFVMGVSQEVGIGKTMRGLLEEHCRIAEILTCFEMKEPCGRINRFMYEFGHERQHLNLHDRIGPSNCSDV